MSIIIDSRQENLTLLFLAIAIDPDKCYILVVIYYRYSLLYSLSIIIYCPIMVIDPVKVDCTYIIAKLTSSQKCLLIIHCHWLAQPKVINSLSISKWLFIYITGLWPCVNPNLRLVNDVYVYKLLFFTILIRCKFGQIRQWSPERCWTQDESIIGPILRKIPIISKTP